MDAHADSNRQEKARGTREWKKDRDERSVLIGRGGCNGRRLAHAREAHSCAHGRTYTREHQQRSSRSRPRRVKRATETAGPRVALQGRGRVGVRRPFADGSKNVDFP